MTFSCTHSFGSCTRPNTNMGSLFSKNKRAPLDTCDKRRIGIELPFQWDIIQDKVASLLSVRVGGIIVQVTPRVACRRVIFMLSQLNFLNKYSNTVSLVVVSV